MLIVVALIFLATPVIEIVLFIRVGEAIGVLPTIGLVLLAAAAGSAVIRFGAPRAIGMAQDSLRAGVAPVREVMDGVAILLAGVLLIVPGFFTDAIGLLLLIPWVRRGIGYAFIYAALSRSHGQARADASGIVEGDFEVVRKPGEDGRQPRLPPSA